MNKYLKEQLYLTVSATILWFVALCATLHEYQYYSLGKPSCFGACIPPIVLGTCAITYFWWLWVIDYKKYKNEDKNIR